MTKRFSIERDVFLRKQTFYPGDYRYHLYSQFGNYGNMLKMHWLTYINLHCGREKIMLKANLSHFWMINSANGYCCLISLFLQAIHKHRAKKKIMTRKLLLCTMKELLIIKDLINVIVEYACQIINLKATTTTKKT